MMRRLSPLNVGIQLLVCLGYLALANCPTFAQSQRFVQIDVRVVGGNPVGLEPTSIDGNLIQAWDTSFFNKIVVPPDPKICVDNKCVKGDCPNLYFCSFIGVPISSDTFNLEVWDADIKSDFDDGDDLIGEGVVRGLNRTYDFGRVKVTVTEIPCSDKQIQVNYDPNEPTGHYRFDSGFYHYPILLGQGSSFSPIDPKYHRFARSKPICIVGLRGCDIKTVFETMISQVRFVAPSEILRRHDPVVNCKINELVSLVGLDNPVRTRVDAINSTIVNYTLEEHIFYPGKITRKVIQDGGSIVVTTEGEGFGQYASFNEFFGENVIFDLVDTELSDAVAKKLTILNKPANYNKPSKKVKNRKRS